MNNQNISEQEKFVNDLISLFFDNERNVIFIDRELSNVKSIIADNYYSDELILSEISKNENFRIKFGSPQLVENIVNDFSRNIKPDSSLDYFIETLKFLNSFEKQYYNDATLFKSLSIIHQLLVRHYQEFLHTSPQNTEVFKGYIVFFEKLFCFFKKIITSVKINQKNGPVYLTLYNQVKSVFADRNFRSSDVFFKYYHLFIENTKDSISIAEVDNIINQFLSTYTLTAKRIYSDILSVEGVGKFFERRNFKTTIFNMSKVHVDYMKVFYSDFSDKEKMELLNNWLQFNSKKTLDVLLGLLKNIDFKIPDEETFGSNIVLQLNKLPNVGQKQKLLDLLFNLDLSDNFDYSGYSQFVISDICSTNIDHHLFGIQQYESRSKFINSEKLKEKAVPFLITGFNNLSTYHIFFENILKLKIGIDKRHFDEQVRDTANAVTNISSYLIQTGNSKFFEIISTKLSNYTIGVIGERIIDNLNPSPKYKELILSLEKKKNALKKDTISKLNELLFQF